MATDANKRDRAELELSILYRISQRISQQHDVSSLFRTASIHIYKNRIRPTLASSPFLAARSNPPPLRRMILQLDANALAHGGRCFHQGIELHPLVVGIEQPVQV